MICTSIGDETPPTITLTVNPRRTNETATIEWKINEAASCSCTLLYPDSEEKMVECNRSWTGTNLRQGNHILKIKATDLEGNIAYLPHSWFVGT